MGIFDFFKKKGGEVQTPAETENVETPVAEAGEENTGEPAEGSLGNEPEQAETTFYSAEKPETADIASERKALEAENTAAAGAESVGEPVGNALTNEPAQKEHGFVANENTGTATVTSESEQAPASFSGAESTGAEAVTSKPARESLASKPEQKAAENTETVEAKTDVLVDENAETVEPESEPKEEAPVKKGFFRKLVEGLSKTRQHVMQGVNDVLSSFTSIDDEFYEELEEALIMGDLGVNTAIKIVAGLKTKVKERKIKDPQQVKSLLKEELKEQMRTTESAYDFVNRKSVILVIGVNGVGKTTTIGKLAAQYKKDGKQVMLAAADTFRAAAIDQLKEWASRSDVPIVAQAENSDPGAVIFDAIASAKSKGVDILICDTAGRLHNKKNLMAELGKIYRIIGREYPEAHLEVFLVLDSTTGQNALVQAKEFKEMADITGIVLTKLDGTSKGGIAVAITADLALPVKYIGVGEGIEDLRPFDADSFIEALFEE